MGMFDFLKQMMGKSDEPKASGDDLRSREELWEAVDLVVKLSHPNVSAVPDYRKKLIPAVEHTLAYADELIRQVPDSIPVEVNSWDTNPFLRTAFADSVRFTDFFTNNPKLKDFFQKTDATRCCALMTMNRTLKKSFGVEMEGDIMKRDVLQTTVDFSDHRLVARMKSEEETRKELSLRVLVLLADHCLEDILSLKEWKKEMEDEKQILEIKLQIQDARTQHRNSLLLGYSSSGRGEKNREAVKVLAQLDQKIAEVGAQFDEPEDYLEKIENMLYHPERFLCLEPVRMFVNDMNVVMENEKKGRGDEICFVELTSATGLQRAVVLIDCQKF